jgi:hypothetical protein
MSLAVLLIGFGTWFLAIAIHEYNHYLTLKRYLKREVKVRVEGLKIKIGFPEDYACLGRREKLDVFANGVLAGLLPLLIMAFMDWIYWLWIILYILGSKNDLRQIYRLYNEKVK